jgi:exopolyphosphatase/guanosine-5'-triphosphate,3'-diphosphate pyrophosphatase
MTDSVTRFAALDIGSNSLHLARFRILPDGTWEQDGRHKEAVRLAEGLERNGNILADDAIGRALAALSRCLDYAGQDCLVRAVATSAVRDARNRWELLDRIRRELGLEVDVVSGYEEARLIWMGLQADPALAGKQVFSLDIGGGSTEFCLGEGDRMDFASSLPLGGVRIAGNFFPDGETSPKSVKQCRQWIEGRLEPVVRALRGKRWDMAVCSAGTAGTLVRMAVERREGRPPLRSHGLVADAQDVLAVCREVYESRTAKLRRKLPGIDEKRADILPAGALVVECVVQAMGIEALGWSGYGLREGVLRDHLERLEHAKGSPVLNSWRRKGVVALADSFSLDRRHDEQVESLSRELFVQLQPWHGLDENAGELLEAAAHLHEVGLRVGFEEHHKHSYYVIRHSHLLSGFVDREVEIMALTARYHRKSHPKPTHPEWMALPEPDRGMVRMLAGILRVADGLDRRHRAVVRGLKVHEKENGIVVVVQPVPGEDSAMELWAAESKLALLREALGIPVTLVSAP